MEEVELAELLRERQDRDSLILLSHILNVRPSELFLIRDRKLSRKELESFAELLNLREKGYPTAYIIGEWECMGRAFLLEEGILIPRPETELLIEKLLELLPKEEELIGYEIGVGSGCISINLLLELPGLEMWGVDLSPKAVRVCRENAEIHGVSDRLRVFKGMDFEPVEGRKFDFIVSNPPYIPSGMWAHLPEEVRREGKESLIGGEKGYEFYERVIPQLKDFLREGGVVAFEIGHDQGKVVGELFEKEGFRVKIYKDYNLQDRIAIGWKS